MLIHIEVWWSDGGWWHNHHNRLYSTRRANWLKWVVRGFVYWTCVCSYHGVASHAAHIRSGISWFCNRIHSIHVTFAHVIDSRDGYYNYQWMRHNFHTWFLVRVLHFNTFERCIIIARLSSVHESYDEDWNGIVAGELLNKYCKYNVCELLTTTLVLPHLDLFLSHTHMHTRQLLLRTRFQRTASFILSS